MTGFVKTTGRSGVVVWIGLWVASAFGFVLGNALARPSSPQAKPGIEVRAEVDRNTITIGDRITYTITIVHDESLKVQQPGPGANLGQFEIKDYHIAEPRHENGRLVEQFRYVISVFDTGRFVIPPFPVAVSLGDTSQPVVVQSEAIPIYVKSVLNSPNAELKDIKPPVVPPVNYWRWVLLAGGVLLLMGLALLGWYGYRRRKEGQPLFRKEVIRPAHEIALEAIQALRESDLLARQDYKTFFTRLSDIVRTYLENRFFVPAMEATTDEILEAISSLDLEAEHRGRLEQVLRLCDLVKFARYQPEPTEIEGALAMTKAFVQGTRIEFEPVEVLRPQTGEGEPAKPAPPGNERGKPDPEANQDSNKHPPDPQGNRPGRGER